MCTGPNNNRDDGISRSNVHFFFFFDERQTDVGKFCVFGKSRGANFSRKTDHTTVRRYRKFANTRSFHKRCSENGEPNVMAPRKKTCNTKKLTLKSLEELFWVCVQTKHR
jgi:hypothetical protein